MTYWPSGKDGFACTAIPVNASIKLAAKQTADGSNRPARIEKQDSIFPTFMPSIYEHGDKGIGAKNPSLSVLSRLSIFGFPPAIILHWK